MTNNSIAEPKVILVDTRDCPIGTAPKSEAHCKATLHRAFSVFLYHEGKMLLQQRAEDKYHSGGLWSNSCCSHPRPGEALADAVQLRMTEELGFCCSVTELFDFIYLCRFHDHLYEYEYDHVFLGEYAGTVTLNPAEAQAVRWISLEELERELVERPTEYAVWFLTAAPRVIAAIRQQQAKEFRV
ncbi:MAG: isopentenyl-diphosphate Delta-isomerase [Angelakisella sp.]